MLWWIVAGAHAGGVLVVDVEGPCVVVVNLVPRPSGGEDVVVPIDSGRVGNQNVTIRNLLGQTSWSGKVEVPEGHRVVARWSGGAMTLQPPIPLADGKAAKAEPQKAPPPRPSAPVPPSSVGRPDDIFLSAVAQAVDQGGGGAPIDDATPPPAGSPAAIRLVNPSMATANVSISGTMVTFRGERSKDLTIASGAHRVVIADDRGTWWSGTLWVYSDIVVELEFSKTAPPRVTNRPEAWRSP